MEREKKEHLEALARSISPNRGHTPDMKASISKAKEMAEKMSTKDFILNTHRILSDQPEFKELVFDQEKTRANMPGPKLKIDLERFKYRFLSSFYSSFIPKPDASTYLQIDI